MLFLALEWYSDQFLPSYLLGPTYHSLGFRKGDFIASEFKYRPIVLQNFVTFVATQGIRSITYPIRFLQQL